MVRIWVRIWQQTTEGQNWLQINAVENAERLGPPDEKHDSNGLVVIGNDDGFPEDPMSITTT